MIRIENVRDGSIAENLGIESGEYVISIDNREINDPLDLKFFESGSSFNIKISNGKRTKNYHVEKEAGIPLGIEPCEFKTKICNNHCIFCFVNQNPRDVRDSLKFKDDDYRLSFLYGNYITLTNLEDDDFNRILELKLSPLYISVHATPPEKRVELMRNHKASRINEQLKLLAEGGINLHTQIVLIPEVNDGEVLQETIEDLLDLYPSVLSVGIVPVGLTDYRNNLPKIKNPDPEWMEEVIETVVPYQREMKKSVGEPVVYLADEFHIKTENCIPPAEHYSDFSQLENGIGMARKFLEGIKDTEIPDLGDRVALITGTLAYEIIEELADKFRESGIHAEVIPFVNRFFGPRVEVAGLLGGWDLLGRISILDFDSILLPPDILNRNGLFIDGCSLDIFKNNLPMNIYVGPYDIRNLESIK